VLPRLFHGTYSKHLKAITTEGLNPRRLSGVAGIDLPGLLSHPNMVYLTTAHAPKYACWGAAHASTNDHDEYVPVLIEVNTEVLDRSATYPDEDYLKHLLNTAELAVEGELDREKLFAVMMANQPLWQQSLNEFGSLAYMAEIPASALTTHVFETAGSPQREAVAHAAYSMELGSPLTEIDRSQYHALTSAMCGEAFCPTGIWPQPQLRQAEDDVNRILAKINHENSMAEWESVMKLWPDADSHQF
jgi:hypothetical protein